MRTLTLTSTFAASLLLSRIIAKFAFSQLKERDIAIIRFKGGNSMRMLQYKLQLTEIGYLVASGEIHHQEEAYPAECLPIRLTIQEPGVDHVVKCISDVITENQKFKSSCKQVLLGKYVGCYLYSFEVQPTHIVLSYTHGTIILEPKGCGIDFQFDVPHKNTKRDSKYRVSLYCNSDLKTKQKIHTARVHEYVGDTHRELLFEQVGETVNYDNRYVFVDEYVDP